MRILVWSAGLTAESGIFEDGTSSRTRGCSGQIQGRGELRKARRRPGYRGIEEEKVQEEVREAGEREIPSPHSDDHCPHEFHSFIRQSFVTFAADE